MMKESTMEKADQLLNKIIDMADKGVDQAPAVITDLAHEYVAFLSIDLWIGFVAALLSLAVGVLIILVGVYYQVKLKYGIGQDWVPLGFISTLFILFGAGMAFDNGKKLLQLEYSPKIYMIEHIRKGGR